MEAAYDVLPVQGRGWKGFGGRTAVGCEFVSRCALFKSQLLNCRKSRWLRDFDNVFSAETSYSGLLFVEFIAMFHVFARPWALYSRVMRGWARDGGRRLVALVYDEKQDG
jgi:hypothetical protein